MNFAKPVQVLADAGVEFVVIGGLAANLLGSARNTFDVDICFSRSKSNLLRLSQALAPYHPRPRGFPDSVPFVWDQTTLSNGAIFTLTTDLGSIDLLAEVAGVGSYDEAKAHSVVVDAFERKIQTLDLPALIAAKKAAGRPKDMESLLELESLLESQQPD